MMDPTHLIDFHVSMHPKMSNSVIFQIVDKRE